MTTVIARELSITYNSYKVGGDQANRLLNEVHMVTNENEKGIVEYTFTIRHDTVAAFKAEIQAVETAFRTPFKDTTVTQAGQNFIDWKQSTSYGYNAKPQIVKYGDKDDGGFARWYRVRVEVGLPADVNNTSFGRNRFINVAYSPSRRRTVTISGTYTANGSTGARAQYQAVFDAYATSVTNALGGTYKKLEEPQGAADENDKEVTFSVTYEEIIYTGVGASDSSLRGEQLTIVRSRTGPGDTPAAGTVERLIHLTATYEAWFDKTVTTALTQKWEGLRAAVVTAIQNTLTGGSLAVVEESPAFDWSNNKFTVTLSCMGSTRNGICEYKETIATDIFTGQTLVGTTDGDPFSKFKYGGPGKWQVSITQEFTSIAGDDPPLFTSDAATPPNGLEVVQISSHRSENPVRWGLPNFSQVIDATRVTKVRVFEFYKVPQTQTASPGGSSGGGTGSTGSGTVATPGDAGSTPSQGDNVTSEPGGANAGMDFEPGVFPPGFFDENGGIPGVGAGSGPIPRPGQGEAPR